MKKYIIYFLLLGFTFVVSETSACNVGCTPAECADDQNGFCYDPEDADIPIDGGISLLIAGGAALGLGGLYKKKKTDQNV